MERTVTIVGVLVLAAILGFAGYLFVANPMADRSQKLNDQIAAIQPIEVPFPKPNWDFDKWQNSVAAKPNIWQELVEAPPPAPPPPPKPPDLKALLQGVSPTRQQVGSRVKIITAQNPKGVFMGVGDTLNGLSIKTIERTEVILALIWEGKELTISLPRK